MFSTHRVVCLDDEPAILRALLRAFREESFEVLPTEDPLQALEWLREGGISVLLADYRLPGMSGTMFLENARQLSPTTARILLTGFAGEVPVLAGRKAGLFTVFAKPWNDRELLRTVREQLRDRELEGVRRSLRRPKGIRIPAAYRKIQE